MREGGREGGRERERVILSLYGLIDLNSAARRRMRASGSVLAWLAI